MSSEYDKFYTIEDSSQDNFTLGIFEKEKKSDVLLITKEDTKLSPNSKVQCTNCTTKFFQIFFKESDKYNEDPIMQDILSKEVFMPWDPVNKCWRCLICGAVESPESNVITKKDKKLKAFGQEEYREYDKVTKNKPDYIHTLNKKKVDINNLFKSKLD